MALAADTSAAELVTDRRRPRGGVPAARHTLALLQALARQPDAVPAAALARDLGLPRSLQDVRVSPEDFDRIAEQAMRTPWVPRNPRKIDSPAQVREILLLAA